MGFFTTKSDENTHIGGSRSSELPRKGMVQAIKDRFNLQYGQSKGKEQETTTKSPVQHATGLPGLPSWPQQQRTVSGPTPSKYSIDTAPRSTRTSVSAPSSPLPRTRKISRAKQLNTMLPPPVPSKNSRKSTDTVTMTLAVRLNELAVANSEGLLSDDEYRLLRANLFERFASSATVPTEESIVPVAKHTRGATENTKTASVSSHSARPPSKVNPSRTPSLASKASKTSALTGFIQRATGQGSNDYANDGASVFSAKSNSSNASRFLRSFSLGRKRSNSSIRTDVSMQPPMDGASTSSRKRYPASTTDSTRSVRRAAKTPPSSFPTRVTNTVASPDAMDEDGTAADIKLEILAVEAEERRLIDAFNGLELTTLTRKQRRKNAVVDDNGNWSDIGSTDTLTARMRQNAGTDTEDSVSMRSGTTSYSYTNSSKRPKNSPLANVKSSKTSGNSRSNSLHRKTSMSSLSSQTRSVTSIPPVPLLPASASSLGSHNLSSMASMSSLGRSTVGSDHRMQVDEDDPDRAAEMQDIQRRRAEVSERYAEKLSYLRARLKAKELAARLR